MARSYVIELLGPPASGKSGLAAALERLPGFVVVKQHAVGDGVALAWSGVRAGAVLIHRRPAGVGAARHAAWAARVGAAGSVARHRTRAGATAVVLDQGPVYTLGRLEHLHGTTRGHLWWMRRAVATADLLDLLVVLDADVPTLARRLRTRDKFHVARGLGADDLVAYLHRERVRCHHIANLLGRQGTRRLYVDTATSSVSDQAAAVLGALGSPLSIPGSCS